MGIKVVNIETSRVVRIIGGAESAERFVAVAMYQVRRLNRERDRDRDRWQILFPFPFPIEITKNSLHIEFCRALRKSMCNIFSVKQRRREEAAALVLLKLRKSCTMSQVSIQLSSQQGIWLVKYQAQLCLTH